MRLRLDVMGAIAVDGQQEQLPPTKMEARMDSASAPIANASIFASVGSLATNAGGKVIDSAHHFQQDQASNCQDCKPECKVRLQRRGTRWSILSADYSCRRGDICEVTECEGRGSGWGVTRYTLKGICIHPDRVEAKCQSIDSRRTFGGSEHPFCVSQDPRFRGDGCGWAEDWHVVCRRLP
ncbi:unnamed protein product [Vitrella brassicaformis CCMP3155]|uniref:Uncharacterized protein n=1 Tax=Vitrella brassicaformis (strain CCMP3155) TaxID=1169540 RepID=A0A0G4GEV4_VITBC|nr:unnamed protein product [Vitrella brassicaformis CCMP3155]|eukprot:CEM27709.1 unnamed protein product [Vitrella brassicaformis CCMP3155]